MVKKVAVEQRFALLGQAECGVELAARLFRHQTAQKLHISRRYLHVHHEIRTRKGEQHLQVTLSKQRSVNHQQAGIVVQDGQRKRHFSETVDHFAHHIGAFVAVEQAGEHLQLKIGAQLAVLQVAQQRRVHLRNVTWQIGKRTLQTKILHHA